MNLAPNVPDDHTMNLLMQLLHEEIGLPERKPSASPPRSTSINFDLGCDGNDARHLMETLEEVFVIDSVDDDAYRYLKRRAKGRGKKVTQTIGRLYLAIKTQRWDIRNWEANRAATASATGHTPAIILALSPQK